MRVQFTKVGRNQRSWEAEMRELTKAALERQVRDNAQILSKDVDFEYDSKANEGVVYVGGLRVVGSFKVTRN